MNSFRWLPREGLPIDLNFGWRFEEANVFRPLQTQSGPVFLRALWRAKFRLPRVGKIKSITVPETFHFLISVGHEPHEDPLLDPEKVGTGFQFHYTVSNGKPRLFLTDFSQPVRKRRENGPSGIPGIVHSELFERFDLAESRMRLKVLSSLRHLLGKLELHGSERGLSRMQFSATKQALLEGLEKIEAHYIAKPKGK